MCTGLHQVMNSGTSVDFVVDDSSVPVVAEHTGLSPAVLTNALYTARYNIANASPPTLPAGVELLTREAHTLVYKEALDKGYAIQRYTERRMKGEREMEIIIFKWNQMGSPVTAGEKLN